MPRFETERVGVRLLRQPQRLGPLLDVIPVIGAGAIMAPGYSTGANKRTLDSPCVFNVPLSRRSADAMICKRGCTTSQASRSARTDGTLGVAAAALPLERRSRVDDPISDDDAGPWRAARVCVGGQPVGLLKHVATLFRICFGRLAQRGFRPAESAAQVPGALLIASFEHPRIASGRIGQNSQELSSASQK